MSKVQYNLTTKTDKTKFLKLVVETVIDPASKTYSDTVLFYYLGYLATYNTPGDIVEIGVGGSTYPLIELAETNNKIFFIIDFNKDRLDQYADLAHWPNAKLEKIQINSKKLNSHQIINQFSYCHVDGNKDFITTMSDIEFCLDQLSTNGLICQDDYGNNKWPTVTDAVKNLEFCGKIKLIFVGDSSAWFTKPEYYEHWMSLLEKDYEYSLLTALCNITSSAKLSKTPAYFYMNSFANDCRKDDYSNVELDYFNNLVQLSFISSNYLQMPYPFQSKFGKFLTPGPEPDNDTVTYCLTDFYNNIKGIDWPEHTPTTEEEIKRLPDWIKSELENVHKIDIYKIYQGNN
jgi:hypothetical protein